MQFLEVEEDLDVAGRRFGFRCWKRIRTFLEDDSDAVAGSEGMDLDAVAGWRLEEKGIIRMLLLLDDSEDDIVVAG